MHAEQIVLIGPHSQRLPAGGAGEVVELTDRVFVGVLGVDALAGAEVEGAAQDAHHLPAQAPEVHLDTALARVVDRLVLEGADVEGAGQLAVDAVEQIEVERRGDAARVVVGHVKPARVLFEVHADDQVSVGRQAVAERLQKAHGLGGGEIADGRAWEEPRLGPPREILRERHGPGEVADDRPHVEGGKARGQALARRRKRAVGDIDADVGANPRQLPQQDLRLEARAGAEFDEYAAGRHALGHLGRVGFEDRGFRARWIILREPRDLLEQLAAARVIEETAGQGLVRARQAVEHRGGEIVLPRPGEAGRVLGASVEHYWISAARRRPTNCQRWWG